ncbi:MAG: N-acetylmuramoyl-L-alanine amidase [Planctomycetes bacterium]|nr:N-acetylmuramoyl-L-alanine amidase [Planctomycetota bacterium]
MRSGIVIFSLLLLGAAPAFAQGKPPTTWVPANPNFYKRGRTQPIRYVVIHTIEGSAGSGINTFRHGRRKVSAHYIIDFDGKLTQMVKDQDTAWHAGRINGQSIGLEHAGWAGRNKWTMAQYRASARLTRWLCDTYRIPIDRRHIIGHVEAPGATHTDPGRYFDWNLYLRLVREGGGASTPTSAPTTSAPTTSTPSTSTPPTSSPAPSPTPSTTPTTAALALQPLRPAPGEVLGTDDVAADLSGLTTEWGTLGREQRGFRVLVEEVGGALRYDSGFVAGGATRHRVTARLRHGATYRWQVLGWDGQATTSSAWVAFRTDFARGQLTVLSPTGGAVVESTPALRWSSDKPQVSYRVWIDDDADHARIWSDSKELNGAKGLHYVRSRLQPNRTYYWRVMSYDGRGNQTISGWHAFRTSSDYVHTAGDGALNVVALSPKGGVRVRPGERPTLRWAYHSTEGRDQVAFQVQIDDMVADGRLLVDERYAGDHVGYRPAVELPPGTYRWRVRVWDGRLGKGTDWNVFVVPGPATSGLTSAIEGN